jgi:hypothetical protein
MEKTLLACALGALATGLVGISAAQAAPADTSLLGAITGGKPMLEVRTRYEHWDQTKTATLTENGQQLTTRARFGWETASYKNFKALVDFENVTWLGPVRFAITANGGPPLNGADKAKYPAINDPEGTELNRLQLAWTPSKAAQVTLGRQRIQLDDSRFVAAAPWRQDEQTFDAVRIDIDKGRLKGTYVYADKVNRTLAELRDWDSDSHFVNFGWTFAPELRVQALVYAFDFEQAPASSNITKGLRATGKRKVGPYEIAYTATFARQTDWRHRTTAFELDYAGFDISATRGPFTLKAAHDSLEGDGVRGFGSAIGAAHGVNGWADAWSAGGGVKNFPDGLEDTNFTLTMKPKWSWLPSKSEILVRHHDFNNNRTNVDLGHEWNLMYAAPISQHWSMQWKYADFNRVKTVPRGAMAPPASRTKWWLTIEYKL